MSTILVDGTGSGNRAKVDSKNRLTTKAITASIEDEKLKEGNAFNVETPVITLTSGNESGVLYFENTGTDAIEITGFFTLLGGSTGGSGDLYLYYRFNTAGGTLKSSTANTVTAVNKKSDSSNNLSANIYYGAEGKTVDSGLRTITSLSTGTGRNPLFVPVIIGPGDNVTISIKPQSGNTSMDLIAAVDCYIDN